MDVQYLHDQISAVCPLIAGVSIGNAADKSTWIVSYVSAPNSAQLAAVQQAIAAFTAAADAPPDVVTMAQVQVALFLTPSPVNAGKTLLDDVNAAVAAIGGQTAIWWAKAATVHRLSATVAALCTRLGISDAMRDQLCVLAAKQAG